ncbi:MAG: hypothetical protein ABJH45_16455, partial [Paracoccaceae bacterium]
CKFSETRTLFSAHLNMPQNVKEKPAFRNIILPDLLKMLDIGVFQQNKPNLFLRCAAANSGSAKIIARKRLKTKYVMAYWTWLARSYFPLRTIRPDDFWLATSIVAGNHINRHA